MPYRRQGRQERSRTRRNARGAYPRWRGNGLFLAGLAREAPKGVVDEIGAARRLEAFREQTGKLRELWFDTIFRGRTQRRDRALSCQHHHRPQPEGRRVYIMTVGPDPPTVPPT